MFNRFKSKILDRKKRGRDYTNDEKSDVEKFIYRRLYFREYRIYDTCRVSFRSATRTSNSYISVKQNISICCDVKYHLSCRSYLSSFSWIMGIRYCRNDD